MQNSVVSKKKKIPQVYRILLFIVGGFMIIDGIRTMSDATKTLSNQTKLNDIPSLNKAIDKF